jgi:hypothetical protein
VTPRSAGLAFFRRFAFRPRFRFRASLRFLPTSRFPLFLRFFGLPASFRVFAQFLAFFARRFPVDRFFEFGLVVAVFEPAEHCRDHAAVFARRFTSAFVFAARAAAEHRCDKQREENQGTEAAPTSGHGVDFGANGSALERAPRRRGREAAADAARVPARRYCSSSASSPASSSTLTPSRSAFSSFEPGLSPATT